MYDNIVGWTSCVNMIFWFTTLKGRRILSWIPWVGGYMRYHFFPWAWICRAISWRCFLVTLGIRRWGASKHTLDGGFLSYFLEMDYCGTWEIYMYPCPLIFVPYFFQKHIPVSRRCMLILNSYTFGQEWRAMLLIFLLDVLSSREWR